MTASWRSLVQSEGSICGPADSTRGAIHANASCTTNTACCNANMYHQSDGAGLKFQSGSHAASAFASLSAKPTLSHLQKACRIPVARGIPLAGGAHHWHASQWPLTIPAAQGCLKEQQCTAPAELRVRSKNQQVHARFLKFLYSAMLTLRLYWAGRLMVSLKLDQAMSPHGRTTLSLGMLPSAWPLGPPRYSSGLQMPLFPGVSAGPTPANCLSSLLLTYLQASFYEYPASVMPHHSRLCQVPSRQGGVFVAGEQSL